MFKIPRDLIDVDVAQLYGGECLDIYASAKHVILDFTSRDESDADDDAMDTGEGWMASLLPLRQEIMRGDLRALYLAWLVGVWEDDDSLEPPIPPGFSRLSGSLQHLAHFLRLDKRLLQAAMQRDTQPALAEPTREEVTAWVATLPLAEKDALLVTLLTAEGEAWSVANRLRQRFHQAWRQTRPASAQATAQSWRTASDLWQISETLRQEEQRHQAAEAARQRAEQERRAAAQRKQYPASLVTQEPRLWQEVATLLNTTQPTKYDAAVRLLRDLRDLATDGGHLDRWEARLREFRQRYARKSSLMQRFNQAGFP
jgi:hypothetical protein